MRIKLYNIVWKDLISQSFEINDYVDDGNMLEFFNAQNSIIKIFLEVLVSDIESFLKGFRNLVTFTFLLVY